MKNKRAWLKITEAIFGIMLISSILLVVYHEGTIQVSDSQRIISLERELLERIENNYTLRNYTLQGNVLKINSFVNSSLADSSYGHGILICNLTEQCEPDSFPDVKAIYSEDRIFGATNDLYSPKRLRIFVWVGENDFNFGLLAPLLDDGSICVNNSQCSSGFCNTSGFCKTKFSYYFDADCDGYGNGSFVLSEKRPGFVCVNTTFEKPTISNYDCDDSNASRNSGITGSCDDVIVRWYFDADCDGYGNGSFIDNKTRPTFLCANSTRERPTISTSDCNDSNSNNWKNLTGYFDSDGDSYGVGGPVKLCTNGVLPSGYAEIDGDCNDSNPSLTTAISCTLGEIAKSAIAFWSFDSNSLGEEITGTTFTFYNNTTSIDAIFSNGRRGDLLSAVKFDGLNDWIDTNINLNASNMKTIAFFAKFDNPSKDGQEIVDKSKSGEGIEVLLYNGGLSYYVMNGTSTQSFLTTDKSILADGKWHQIVSTFDYPGNISLYLDGNLKTTKILTNNPKDLEDTILFGKWYEPESYSFGGSRFFNGSLDEVMIFNRSLNSTEILELYNAWK